LLVDWTIRRLYNKKDNFGVFKIYQEYISHSQKGAEYAELNVRPSFSDGTHHAR
jgi:hypothetical protein